MDRDHRTQRRDDAAADRGHDAPAPGRGTLVDEAGDAEAPLPRLELRPSGTGAGGGQPGSAPAAQPAAQPAAPAQSAGQTPAPAAQPAQAVASPVTHRTEHVAPNNATRTRTTVGVGEVVHFSSAVAGAWRASQVGVSTAATATGTTYRWKAPSVPGAVTITFTPSGAGQAPVPTQLTVIAPRVEYRNGVRVPTPNERPGAAGVMMHSRVVFGPDTVSFANTMWSEDPGPPTGMARYFSRWRPRRHEPELDPMQIDPHNHGPIDEAGYWDLPSTQYADGGEFEWVIPTNYTVFGDSERHRITNVHQHFTLAADGTMTVTKGSAHATRRP